MLKSKICVFRDITIKVKKLVTGAFEISKSENRIQVSLVIHGGYVQENPANDKTADNE